MDGPGNVYVADTGNNRIQKFDSTGGFLGQWGSRAPATASSIIPRRGSGRPGNVYVADTGNNRIQKFDSSGAFLGPWGSHGTGNGLVQ